jgi:glucan 1,4-alpha-glucosidase
MKTFFILALILLWNAAGAQTIYSPSGVMRAEFKLTDRGEPSYSLFLGKKEVIKPSKLGLVLKDAPSFTEGFTVLRTDTSTYFEVWQPVWGEVRNITNHYRELAVKLRQTQSNVNLTIRFRLFNDGLAFRYEFPEQSQLNYFIVVDELTEFQLAGDHKAFWIPGDYDSNEYPYSITRLSQVDATIADRHTEIGVRSPIGKKFVQTPLLLNTDGGMYINIHEAALVNYPAMQLQVKDNALLMSHLVPDAVGNKAYLQTPFQTPWRTIIASYKATDLLASKTILNLNEPSKIANPKWIKPQKFLGVWWEMHVGIATWNYANQSNIALKNTDWKSLTPNGTHGATTLNTKKYIDFAAEHGFDGVLVEGWNVGWEDWFGKWKEDVFDFVTPYPDFDLAELKNYAHDKGVKLIMHHETSGSVTNYERKLDEAIQLMKSYDYPAVKTGYVGKIIPRGEHHDGQWMVNHYLRVADKLANNQLMLDAHEPVRPTGLHRTYPNWMASEAARGNEFNAWSVGNPPEHETILPFTRLMGGPMDYTPGIFQIKMDFFKPGSPYQVHTTLAKQLALYVTMYSPFQMAADLPESYRARPDAFQFIKDVPVDWDDTRVLLAEPGDYLAIARKAKGKPDWFLGAITDEEKRALPVTFDFLDDRQSYVVTIYGDALDAHWKDNPMAYEIKKFIVNRRSVVKLNLAAGGGAALHIKPASAEESKKVKRYRPD